ncbi:MAG: hypothetical protein AAB229_06575 [Candidatus Hydrogenedentota bacterium]
MRWYLFRNETVHGPYEKEDLKSFLTATDQVAREGSDAWGEAQKDGALEDIFTTFIQPDLEWYVTLKGKPTRGPFAQSALLNLLKKNEIGPNDSIRHTSWPKAVPLRETRIHKYMSDAAVRLEDVPPDEWKEAPKVAGSTAPVRPSGSASSAAGKKNKFKLDIEWNAMSISIVIAALLLPLVGYMSYDSAYKGSDLELRIQYGKPAGDCRTDETSKNICGDRPLKCACKTKGDCGMPECARLGQILDAKAGRHP